VGNDRLLALKGYVYFAPTALSFVMRSLATPGHRFALTRGYGHAAPLVLGLSSAKLSDFIRETLRKNPGHDV
jgi:hypothetical protein